MSTWEEGRFPKPAPLALGSLILSRQPLSRPKLALYLYCGAGAAIASGGVSVFVYVAIPLGLLR